MKRPEYEIRKQEHEQRITEAFADFRKQCEEGRPVVSVPLEIAQIIRGYIGV